MSPILVRPVREQLEHDRVIRLLQARLKRRYDVVVNIGEDQTTPVKVGLLQIYPDLVLTSTDRSRKLMGTIEVETSESVNYLEARAQWAHLGRARAPFHLYVPAGSVEMARRLAAENQVSVAEIWSYHTIADQTRFTLVHRAQPAVHPPAPEPARPGTPAVRRAAASKKRLAPKKRSTPPASPRKAAARATRARTAARKAPARTQNQKRK